jgi:hypothetical protein
VYGDDPLTIFGGKVTEVTDKAVVIEPGTRVNASGRVRRQPGQR